LIRRGDGAGCCSVERIDRWLCSAKTRWLALFGQKRVGWVCSAKTHRLGLFGQNANLRLTMSRQSAV
jgi:hypothetical protein